MKEEQKKNEEVQTFLLLLFSFFGGDVVLCSMLDDLVYTQCFPSFFWSFMCLQVL